MMPLMIFGISWGGFIVLYFVIGLVPSTIMVPIEELKENEIDPEFGIDFTFDPTVFLVIWLFWPIVIAYKILKLIFYTLPKDIVYVVKYLIRKEKESK